MSSVETIEDLRKIVGNPHELVTKKILTSLDEMAYRFIGKSPFAMLATSNKDGVPDVSPRGDETGFVHIADNTTLYLPERPGNKLAFSLENILENENVALFFIIPGVNETYRVHGTARIVTDPEVLNLLLAHGRPPRLAIEVKVKRAFLHCGKAIIRSELWKENPEASTMKFKFGAPIARQSGGGEEVEKLVNKLVEEDYKDGL
jgi:PPOX class probable FMN-dependent enzyme